MSDTTSTTDRDNTEYVSHSELTAIKKKREALEQIVKVSLTLDRLQTGLQTIMLMGKPSSDVPQSAIRLFKALSDGVTHYPNMKIQESLSAVEEKVKGDIAKVVKVAQASNEITGEDTDSEDFDVLNRLLHEFRRRAQTAVALNLLLRKRGAKPKELSFKLPTDLIDITINNLDTKEKECKTVMKENISSMQDDLDIMLENETLPEEMREEMLAMKDSFSKNLDHLESGKILEDMPIVIEMVEVGAMQDHSTPFSSNVSVLDEVDNSKDEIPDESSKSEDTDKKKRGFFSKTKKWMSTPFDVKWKDIE